MVWDGVASAVGSMQEARRRRCERSSRSDDAADAPRRRNPEGGRYFAARPPIGDDSTNRNSMERASDAKCRTRTPASILSSLLGSVAESGGGCSAARLRPSRAKRRGEAERLGFAVERRTSTFPRPQSLEPSEIVEIKARTAYRTLSRPVAGGDSGLAIEAWGGFTGALVSGSRRAPGSKPRAHARRIPDRSATAVCAIAYCDGAEAWAARGEVRGTIARTPRGSGGSDGTSCCARGRRSDLRTR